jgi:hypothetical protein
MFNDWHYMVVQDRAAREQDFAERTAERGRYARLFDLAVAAEREETWRVVWEKLEAKGRL